METKIHRNNTVSYYDWTSLTYREKIDPKTIPQNHLKCLNRKDVLKIEKLLFKIWKKEHNTNNGERR